MQPNPCGIAPQKARQKQYMAALYLRLSKEDEGTAESASIDNQRKLLRRYAAENGIPVYAEYIDDGWSGTSFDRPDFQRMLRDIEAGRFNMVLTKDLSRLGRDYIKTGEYTELYFPAKGVRYVAVNDGYDSESPYTDIAPFKNVINEMYARDTSKKIRSSFHTKMQEGAYIGNFAPYGYQKDRDNKNRLVPDGEAAPVVLRIFRLSAQGTAPSEIARMLNAEGVPPPIMRRLANHPGLNVDAYSRRKEWGAGTIAKILRNMVYLGHMAQGKTTKLSFKSGITIRNDETDWIVVRDTHAPLIDAETFEIARKAVSRRTYRGKGFHNIFSGIARCADCGKAMSTVGTRRKGATANLSCGAYKRGGSRVCTNHSIDYDTLCELVLCALRSRLKLTKEEREELTLALKAQQQAQAQRARYLTQLEGLRRRERGVDATIEKLYADHREGTLSDSRLKKLLEKYEAEAADVEHQIAQIEGRMTGEQSAEDEAGRFERLIRDYTEFKVLTPELIYKFIERIDVYQGCFETTPQGKIKRQKIAITFRFVTQPEVWQYEK